MTKPQRRLVERTVEALRTGDWKRVEDVAREAPYVWECALAELSESELAVLTSLPI